MKNKIIAICLIFPFISFLGISEAKKKTCYEFRLKGLKHVAVVVPCVKKVKVKPSVLPSPKPSFVNDIESLGRIL